MFFSFPYFFLSTVKALFRPGPSLHWLDWCETEWREQGEEVDPDLLSPSLFFTFIFSIFSPVFPFTPSRLQQWLKLLDVLVCPHPPHPTTTVCEEDRGWLCEAERVCWGIKDPLSPKPSSVHPTESPDGVIQPSWSLESTYSFAHAHTHTLRYTQRESHWHPFAS